MDPPGFWQRDGIVPRLLDPLGRIGAAFTARRVARPGWQAPVPVLCCGNAGVGGAGKTPLALDLAIRLRARGLAPAFLTRGHGGRLDSSAVLRIVGQGAAEVGDEPLLLAAIAPTFRASDRAAGARAAIAAGATVLVMDDGLQNPSLLKDLSLLVVDGGAGFGNGRTLPAGPLREPVAGAARRCRAAVLIGEDATGARATLPHVPVLQAWLRPDPVMIALAGRRVLAFAGIGRPEKFFASLERVGADLVLRRPFPDHHAYTPRELHRLLAEAERRDLLAVTTSKDAVRLPPSIRDRVRIAGITLAWSQPALIEALLTDVIAG